MIVLDTHASAVVAVRAPQALSDRAAIDCAEGHSGRAPASVRARPHGVVIGPPTARAEDELRAAGARPRRRVQSGADSLTASELRVARLAAEGRSNTEIAQELFVSLKTVETHLSHAYAKLGLSGQGARGHLAQALRPRSAR